MFIFSNWLSHPEAYNEVAPDAELIAYRDGYKGLCLETHFRSHQRCEPKQASFSAAVGSPIGNSRVKLTNIDDCLKRGFIEEEQTPLHVAAERLRADGVTILPPIGGDDTNTTADLAKYLGQRLSTYRRRSTQDGRQ